ncbi:MAG: CRISPR-associated endonuclease Cas3'' [Pirellulaceae bacterium]
MQSMLCYAHSLDGRPQSAWETMAEHENRVAERCSEFLARFHPDLSPWGDLLGRSHDLGKYSDEFQTYICQANRSNDDDAHQSELRGRVDHSTAAAQWIQQRCESLGKLFSYIFAGHHAGLADWDDGESHAGLRHRLQKEICDWQKNAPTPLVDLPIPAFPKLSEIGSRRLTKPVEAAFRVQFLCRMMFSGLVDADFLATEQFMSSGSSSAKTQPSVLDGSTRRSSKNSS